MASEIGVHEPFKSVQSLNCVFSSMIRLDTEYWSSSIPEVTELQPFKKRVVGEAGLGLVLAITA